MSIATTLPLRSGDADDPYSFVPDDLRPALVRAFDTLPSEVEEAFVNGEVSSALGSLGRAGYRLLAFEVSMVMPNMYSV